MSIPVDLHRSLVMRRRVRQLAIAIDKILPNDIGSLLDVGAGTGEMAVAVMGKRKELIVAGVDVYVRPEILIPVCEYDGESLPYEDGAFDAIMLIDVLHHCHDPESVLRECARVSRKYIFIKDHIADSYYDDIRLRFMDWVGNRAHGVALPYNYLSSVSWRKMLSVVGLTLADKVDDLALYPVFAENLFGGRLHCCWLLRIDGKL